MSKYMNAPLQDVLFFQEGPGVRNSQYTVRGIKLLNVANLQDGKVDLNTSERYISEDEAYGKYRHFLVEEGDLIIASSGIKVEYFDKKMGFISKEHLPLCMNTSTIRFKSLNENIINIKYFMYYMKTYYFKTQLSRLITGSAQLNFGPSHLKQMIVPLPPIEEQKKIAEILDKASNLISLRKKQIEKLDLLFKVKFIDIFGDMDTNPNNFPKVTLDEICIKITDGKHGGCEVEDGSGYYFIGAREIYDGEIHYDTAPEITYKDFEKDYKRCNIENGDFVIVNTGATIGKTAIANNSLTNKTLLQKSVALLKAKQGIAYAKFLQYCYITNPKIYKVESASAQPNLLISKIKKTSIYLPPLDMQSEFVLFAEKLEKQKVQLQQGLEKLELSYKALMQQYFG